MVRWWKGPDEAMYRRWVINLDVWGEIPPVFVHYKQKTRQQSLGDVQPKKAVESVMDFGVLRLFDNETFLLTLDAKNW